jgi:dCTP deaminase
MILTDEQIKEAILKKQISIIPFDENQVQPATYDFKVGKYGATASSKQKVNIEEKGFISIEQGDFAVVEVLEELKMGPQYTARFGLRSKYARKGLIATTGTQIDPGFEGRLIIGLTNLTPKTIALSHNDHFISVEFHKLEKPSSRPYSGPYQNKMGIGAEEMEFIAESEGMALSEMLNTLRSLSQNVGTLSQDVTRFTGQFSGMKWILGIMLAIIAILMTLFALK